MSPEKQSHLFRDGRFGSKPDVQIAPALRPLSVEKQTLGTAMSAFGGKADSIQHGLSGPLFDLVVSGESNKGVARHLDISERTVEIHRANVMRKMRATSLADLVKLVASSSGA